MTTTNQSHDALIVCPSCEGTGECHDREHIAGDPYHHNDCYACEGDGTVTLASIKEHARMNFRDRWMVEEVEMAIADQPCFTNARKAVAASGYSL